VQRERLDALRRKALAGAPKMLDALEALADSAEKASDRVGAAGKYLDVVLRLCGPAALDVRLQGHDGGALNAGLTAEHLTMILKDKEATDLAAKLAAKLCPGPDIAAQNKPEPPLQ